MEPATTENADTAKTPPSAQQVNAKTRDTWDKLDIVFRSIGAVGTTMVVALVGILGSNYLGKRQADETNLRLYTELMSKREEADTSLRKEMFNSIITHFLAPASDKDPDKTVLNLELLAYNFHDSLDLGPLFKDVYRNLDKNPLVNQPYIDRLSKVTRDVIRKQVAMLAEAGGKLDGNIIFEDLKEPVTVISDFIIVKATNSSGQVVESRKKVQIVVFSKNLEKRELDVWLTVKNDSDTNISEAETSAYFTVSFFDFPMLDNVRLPGNFRGAVVLNSFDKDASDFTFVYFPSSRAGLKERPYYDEIIHNLRSGMR